MKCRICGREISSGELVTKVNVEVCNVFSSPVNTPKVDVVMYTCSGCGHHQIESIFNNSHYEKYNLLNVDDKRINGGGNASARMSYYEGVLAKLQSLSVSPDKILDIGCGHGEILIRASEFFGECIGVEPSKSECLIAREMDQSGRMTIINAFFDDDFKEEGFSAILSTQVFEHLENPLCAMANAYRVLADGGVGYFDVPNGQKIYDNSEYYNIYAEHVNYYTVYSLSALAKKVGFEIISAAEIMDGNHIALYVKKPVNHTTFDKKRTDYINKIEEKLSEYNNIAIWGCGIKGRNFISCLPYEFKKKVKNLFDSNHDIAGCYVNDCDVSISSPSKAKLQESDLVLITALEYKNDILVSLRKDFDFSGEVIVLDDEM